MMNTRSTKPEDLDWAKYKGSLPLGGVVYPQGQDRTKLAARMRRASTAAKVGQTV